MAFQRKEPAQQKAPMKSQPAQKPAAAQAARTEEPKGNDKPVPTKPDFILKVKITENGKEKFVRIGGMWATDKGGFKITIDEDVEITSTKTDRFKCMAFPNDFDDKFNKDGSPKRS